MHQVPEQRGVSFFDLMENFKLGPSVLCTYLAGLLAAFLVGVCIRRLAYLVSFGASRKPKLFKGYLVDRNSGITKLPALAIFALFMGQFFWLTELFLTNNIKVEV